MSFKNALTKMGLIEEEAPAPKGKTAQPATSGTPTYSPEVRTSYTPSYTPTPSVDPAINDMLAQSLQENKLSGFDYLKFVSAVEEMKSTGTPEDARYKMAGFTAKQMGVDKNGLLKSGEHYLDVLGQDESDFNADCSQFEKRELQSRETKISQLENTISTLTKQLAQAQQDHSTLAQELQDQKAQLESRRTAFQATLQNFKTNIQNNIQKINQYLQ